MGWQPSLPEVFASSFGNICKSVFRLVGRLEKARSNRLIDLGLTQGRSEQVTRHRRQLMFPDATPGQRMTQLTFSDAENAGKRKQTRREVFRAAMDQVVPWDALLALIEPHYPKAGRGRCPYPLPPCFGCTCFSSGMR